MTKNSLRGKGFDLDFGLDQEDLLIANFCHVQYICSWLLFHSSTLFIMLPSSRGFVVHS
jgi:hypothetical protein